MREGAYSLSTAVDEYSQDILILRAMKHPDHEPNMKLNDIGILTLDRDLAFSGKLEK